MTLAWWDDLWLNEGFATFVEYVGMDKIAPEWKVVSDCFRWSVSVCGWRRE